MITYADVEKLLATRSEDPPVLSLYLEMTLDLPALRGLPAVQREAVVLAYWGGLTADQIARRSNVPLGTAKSRIRAGIATLRQTFAEESSSAW